MRVLSVVPLYPPHHLGGYEVVCRGVMERFAAAGHDVLVLTSDARLPGREEADDPDGSVSVERVLRGWWDWQRHGALQAGFRERLAIERHNQRVVSDTLARFCPDVVSIWSLVYMSFSIVRRMERARLPLVVSLGDDWMTYAWALDEWTRIFERRPWLRPLGRLTGLETRLPTFAGATVTAASEMIRDSVATSAPWTFPDVAIIRMGVETRDFPLIDPHPEGWAWRLLYVGRVVPNKGIATAIKALARGTRRERRGAVRLTPTAVGSARLGPSGGQDGTAELGPIAMVTPRVFDSRGPAPCCDLAADAGSCGAQASATGQPPKPYGC